MDFPFYLQIGSVKLHPHWLFELLAYAAGFRLYLWLRRRRGDLVTDDVRWWVIAAAAAGAALGSKVLYWLEDPTATLNNWSNPAYLMGGKTIVGGLIGGLLAVEWTKRQLGVTQRTGDLFALPLVVAIAVGRLGCFLTGLSDHTFGVATRLPWGVDFGDGISRHPTQLYEIAFVATLGLFLVRFGNRRREPGDAFKIFMVGYMSFRLLVDFLKPEPRLAGLTTLQWACFAMLVYYAPDVKRWVVATLGPLRGPAPEVHNPDTSQNETA